MWWPWPVFLVNIFIFFIVVRTLERAKSTGNYAESNSEIAMSDHNIKSEESSGEEEEPDMEDVRRKKMKTSSY